MQSLIRSKSAGVTGGRGTAGAGPGRDLLYQGELVQSQAVLKICGADHIIKKLRLSQEWHAQPDIFNIHAVHAKRAPLPSKP